MLLHLMYSLNTTAPPITTTHLSLLCKKMIHNLKYHLIKYGPWWRSVKPKSFSRLWKQDYTMYKQQWHRWLYIANYKNEYCLIIVQM